MVKAYLATTVDIGSVSANSTLTVQVAAPRRFRHNRPVLISLASSATQVNNGILIAGVGRVVDNSGKKIEFKVSNSTGSAIDPAAVEMIFIQI